MDGDTGVPATAGSVSCSRVLPGKDFPTLAFFQSLGNLHLRESLVST